LKTDFNSIRKIKGEGMKSLNGSKGDLYIRFICNLPNYNTLPNDTKTQLKILLQSFDKQEAQLETQISKTPNLTKTILTDCGSEQKIINQFIEQLNNQDKNKKNPTSSEGEMGSDGEHNGAQPQCVQQ